MNDRLRRSSPPRRPAAPWAAAGALLFAAAGCSAPPLAPPPERLGTDRALEDNVAGRDANRRALAWMLARARAQAATASARPTGD